MTSPPTHRSITTTSRSRRPFQSTSGDSERTARRPTRIVSSKTTSGRHSSSSNPSTRPSKRQVLTLFRRLLILIAALFYLNVALQSSLASLRVLVGDERPRSPMLPYDTRLAAKALGTTFVHESLLVATLLQNDTTPRPHGSLYLYEDTEGSLQAATDKCPSASAVDGVYADTFLRDLFTALVRDTAYNLTFLDASSLELVTPVVDCTSGARVFEDATAAKHFYLVRHNAHQPTVSVLVVTMSNQGFQVESRNELGSASVLSLVLLTDLAETTRVDHHVALSLGYPFEPFDWIVYQHVETTRDNFWRLRSVPRTAASHVPTTLLTACRTGVYGKTESEQSNISNAMWALVPANPQHVLSRIEWRGVPTMRDAWAWVHLVHLLLAWEVCFQVAVLLALSGRNLSVRKYWLGDAFVAISSSLVLRGAVVLLSMALNKFWAIREFCLGDAAALTMASNYIVNTEIVHADLLSIYLSVVGLMGKLLKTRIDPALAVALFELGFHFRLAILAWVPALVEIVAATALDDFRLGIVATVDDAAATRVSPMKLWGIHEMPSLRGSFIAVVLFPIFATMVPLVVIDFLRKLLRRGGCAAAKPSRAISTSVRPADADRVTPFTASESGIDDDTVVVASVATPVAISTRKLHTNFELATGARLADQFGLVGDYDNYLHIKGMRFASADGIYSNGFVIVNNRFLIQTTDLPTIVAMKLLGMRFRNVYAYDVYPETHSVGEMARLVYPETMTLTDLASLNINVLT